MCDDIDLVFILDSSGSLSNSQFEDIKNFVKDIIGSLSIGQSQARVGVIIYGVDAQVSYVFVSLFIFETFSGAGVAHR